MILGEDDQKMSKSRGNVVNPDDVVDELRRRRAAPLRDVHGPARGGEALADERGSRACVRFLDRVVDALCTSDGRPTTRIDDETQARSLHKTIKKVDRGHRGAALQHRHQRDDEFSSTTSASSTRRRARPPRRSALLVSPFAPHLGEELWQRLGAPSHARLRALARRSTRRSSTTTSSRSACR